MKHKARGYLAILGGFMIHLCLGNFYTYGNIQPYVVNYMDQKSASRGNVNMGNSVWLFGLLAFGLGASISIGGYLERKIGPRLTTLMGGWLMSINICITSITITSYLWLVALSYGLLAGIGMGLCYGVAIGCPCKYFPEHKGIVSGIIVAGFGLSAVIFDMVQIQIINADTNTTGIIDYDSPNLSYSFLIIGIIYSCIIFFGAMLLKDPVDEKETFNPCDSISFFSFQSQRVASPPQLKPYQLFFEFDFWILWLTFALNAACVILINILFKGFGLLINITDKGVFPPLTIVGIIGALFNCFGRLFWGVVHDRKPYKITMFFLSLSTAAFIGTFIFCNTLSPNFNIYMFSVWLSAINFLNGGNFSIFPAICGKLFGVQNIVENYGILFTSASFGSIISSTITTVVWDRYRGNKESGIEMTFYRNAFIAGAVLSVISAILTLFYRGKSLMHNTATPSLFE